MTEASPLSTPEHFARLQRLSEREREAEKAQRQLELERYSLATREALGKTVSRLTIDGVEQGAAGYQRIVLSRMVAPGELTPFHAMSRGDNVRLTFPAGIEPPFVDGTLEYLEQSRVAVAVDAQLPENPPAGKCHIDLLGSDATYQRMKKALAAAARARANRTAELREICMGERAAAAGAPPALKFFNTALNRWQRDAVRRALAAKDISIVHGPPGTGKTTVLVEIILQAVERGGRVLASAPSNIAVDNILEKLLPYELRVVRLGHPARMLESVQAGNIRILTAEDPQFVTVQEMDAWREQLSRKLARKGSRSVSGEERQEMRREVKRLWKEARKIELAISRRLALSAQVVLTTHGGMSDRILRGEFDWVALDEASQATEPLSWIPLLKAGKVVIAGDSMQLPPTLFSREAAAEGLAVTLFERLQKILPANLQTLLRVQYRMHETIMGFSSQEFYGGKLIADEAVREHLASGLDGVRAGELTSVPMVFVDTAGTGYEETLNELLQSRENMREAELVVDIAQSLLKDGVAPEDMAVLTPYMAQKNVLRTLLQVQGLEIGTVDGFQGREKEVTIVSLVRANERGEVGFLADTRRMNVALTRARRLLVVVGDSVTIGRHPFYRSFLEYAQNNADYRSAWEWMDDGKSS
ncbi:MAG: AAA domain-containing protein [Elusimicrobiota bacterium]